MDYEDERDWFRDRERGNTADVAMEINDECKSSLR